MSRADLLVPRASSMQGKRRRLEPDVPEKSRRTRSVGGDSRDALSSSDRREAREREAFQRQLIGVFVPRALNESLEGNTHNYSDLLSHFLPLPGAAAPQLPPLLPLLRALTAHVSLLDSGVHHALVAAILDLPWATADDRFVKCYIGFCGVLVSAHPGWARDIVAMAIRGLTWQPPQPSAASTPITRRTFHARHHLLISHLLALIPTLPNVLQPILNRSAPNKREPEVVQTTWVRNCCELIAYCPELGARVWSSLVDRMLRIDVEITNRADEDDDDDDDEESDVRHRGDPFDLTVEQGIGGDDEDSDDESDDGEDLNPDDLSSEDERESDTEEPDSAETRKKRREVLRSMRQKLDGMLMYFLAHLDESMRGTTHVSAAELAARDMSAVSSETPSASATPRPGTPSTPSSITGIQRSPPTPAQSLAHFQTLLNLFSRQILPTSSTQHLPFTLFLCSSFSPAHADLFLHRLVSLALYASDTPTPTPTQPVPLAHRTAAAVYIGSLVTRARFVSDEQARTVLQYLLAYVDGKLAQVQSKTRRVAPDELPLFYAVCQAAMVIFCFRWRALTADDEVAGELEMDFGEREWMRDLDVLQRALTSELNPLLGCNPSVVSMFAKVAHSTGFAYCFSIIEANTHAHTKRSAPAIAAPRAARQANIDAGLDSYFPFDPYDLPRSGEFVESLYRTWDEVAVDLGGDSDDSDEEADDSDESMSMGEDELGPGRIPHSISAGKRPLPIAKSGGSSFGEHRRRNLLSDAGLGTSLENMNISPVPSGVLGGA
ncbi:RNA polymerase I-specific transcription initiation factor RRN3 [Cutaneotrichosporon oleaginosum]|uniref:RNA polymerase I-specific transcription initiation factor RRN3 n=1 Tax=Cutaneotrichosporon oleaginosum TaxID=879819 RepID=A0A0J0XTQ7_9TREE|nr:RNA polymerase I-specific transcription initiation factor RRN3 [Cutaneotrichosporon oleaginosum]KLT44471.1 RNA polymerase I-specific transcription initiation factor RRN3 [Cutaneotrichosporon oleaginosum]TXT14010.1 hypothetical protein COLE_00203 [Cutaneotrichosporon oleaginosum]